MQPDPNRQWFVYYNEKEMGPFLEREVVQKLNANEFDGSAYVFTEGMTDWALVQDTPVLQRSEPTATASATASATVPFVPPQAAGPAEPEFAESLGVEEISEEPSLPGFRDDPAPATGSTNIKERTLGGAAHGAEATRAGFGGEAKNTQSVARRGSSAGSSKTSITDSVHAQATVPRGGTASGVRAVPTAPVKEEKRGFSLFSKKKKETQTASAPTPSPTAAKSGNTNAGVVPPTQAAPATPAPAKDKTRTGQTNPGAALPPPTAEVAASAKGDSKKAAAAKTPGAKKPPSPILIGALVFALVGGGLYMAADMGVQIPLLSDFLGAAPSPDEMPPASDEAPPAELAEGLEETPADPNATPGAPPPPARARPQAGGADPMDSLVAFRAANNPQGDTFAISGPVSASFPVVMGALAPALDVQQVAVAVFPENEKNLLPVPQVWYMKAAVLDGYFTVGPLSLAGKPLPPGGYLLYVQLGDKFLGGKRFDVGTWPAPAEVTRLQGEFQKEREKLAASERDAFDAKLREIANAFNQLKMKSGAANRGLKGARDWNSFKVGWNQNLQRALKDQEAARAGPSFYPDAQELLFRYISELKLLYESYELLSKGGAKALARLRPGVTVGKQMAEILKIQTEITTMARGLAERPPQPFQIDPKRIEKLLAEFALSDRIKK